MNMTLALALSGALAQAQPTVSTPQPPVLPVVQLRARELIEERVERRRRLVRLRKDLRYLSEELDRDVLDLSARRATSLLECAQREAARLKGIEERGNLDSSLKPVVERLKELYRALGRVDYARPFATSLMRAVNEELRWAAETGQSADEILSLLDEHLRIPASAIFPEDVSIEDFRRWDPIRAFMVKHRLTAPRSYVKTTVKDLLANKHRVQIGVEIEAEVTYVDDCWFDGDVCFNVGDLHVELPPEYKVLHPEIPLPSVGQFVRLRGWSYLDVFHKSELEYDPDNPRLGLKRPTIWEIHPLTEIEVLK